MSGDGKNKVGVRLCQCSVGLDCARNVWMFGLCPIGRKMPLKNSELDQICC